MGESGEEMVCPGSPGGLSLAGHTDGLAEEGESGAMGYQQTLMYGRYSKSLGDQIKEEAKRQKVVEKLRKKEHKKRKQELRWVLFLTNYNCTLVFNVSGGKINQKQVRDLRSSSWGAGLLKFILSSSNTDHMVTAICLKNHINIFIFRRSDNVA